jgi:transcriptional regulator with XRE-family HTH domain
MQMDSSDSVQQEFGERVRALRKQKGFSQEEFSFECNLDRTYVSQVEQGRRNISLQNIKAMADALGVGIAALFTTDNSINNISLEALYRLNENFSIDCGFKVNSKDICTSVLNTAKQLQGLPFALYQSIDLKTLSSIAGAVFAGCLARQVDAIVNPIEKGHPDIIPKSGHAATEAELRNYPCGLEVKVTVGNVKQGSELAAGQSRVTALSSLTWQAHHQEVESLLGLVIDFAGATEKNRYYPIITGVFFADNLSMSDWGEISGTTGRNTKVTGIKSSGKAKMGQGWVLLLEREDYLSKYSKLLKFSTN